MVDKNKGYLEYEKFEDLEPERFYEEQGLYIFNRSTNKKIENIDWLIKKIDELTLTGD